jgi:proline dehydrogenase
MGLIRRLLLAGSENAWLRRHAPQLPLLKKAVARFMPGEQIEDALKAAAELRLIGIGTVFTELGENISDATDAEAVTQHYIHALNRIHESHLDGHISVKLTQLGLDVDEARCVAHVRSLAERAKQLGTVVWIDMEQHAYVDATLSVYRRTLADYSNVGVCLQAYLYRTANDLASLIALAGPRSQRFGTAGGIRLVKGAYREPETIAYPRKRDVDANFLALAKVMLGHDAQAAGLRAVFGTHDSTLIKLIQDHVAAGDRGPYSAEFHLLYGIQRGEQERLARNGYRVRVLISYGEHWFPWYMRRLAERPANVLFAAKAMLSR